MKTELLSKNIGIRLRNRAHDMMYDGMMRRPAHWITSNPVDAIKKREPTTK
jgi:hypothetical protein